MTQQDDNKLVFDRRIVGELQLVDQFLKNSEPEIAGLFRRERGDTPLLLADVIPRLAEVLVDKKTKPEHRAAAVSHLHDLLNGLCHDQGPGQPISGKFHAVLPQLIQASNDRADIVRQQAVSALGSFLAVCPVQEILPVLISTLTAAKRPAGVVLAALAGIRACGIDAASGAVKELVDLLRHGDPQVHAEVCNVLGWLEQDAEPAIDELTRVAREDTTSAVCLAAVRALAAVDRSGRWIGTLTKDKSVALKIIQFLRDIGEDGQDLRRKLQVEMRGEKAADPPPPPPNEPSHADDFASVDWFGDPYTFTSNQAAAVKLLWEHWERGTPDVRKETILNAADAQTTRLDHVFRKHAAWKTMIVKGEKRSTYRLQEPGDKST